MLNNGAVPSRTWQEIAFDAGKEKDPKRLIELSNELDHALDERKKDLRLIQQNLPRKRTA